jgi:hypothetical protein
MLTLMKNMLNFVRIGSWNSKLNSGNLCDLHISVYCDHIISGKGAESIRTNYSRVTAVLVDLTFVSVFSEELWQCVTIGRKHFITHRFRFII